MVQTRSSSKIKEKDEDVSPSDANSGFLYYLMTNHMWIFAVIIVPISLVYDLYTYILIQLNFYLGASTAKHDEKVANVQEQIEAWKASGNPACTWT